MKKPILLLFISLIILINGKSLFSQDNPFLYIQELSNKAYENFYIGYTIESKNQLEEIIELDKHNYYWESYLYLGQIYLDSGDKNFAINLVQKALEMGSVFLQSRNEYEKFLHNLTGEQKYTNPLDSIISTPHRFPNKLPVPVCGWNKLKSQIKKYFFKDHSEIFINAIITKEGNLARIIIKDINTRESFFPSDSFYQFIFKIEWHPAQYKSKTIDVSFAFSVK